MTVSFYSQYVSPAWQGTKSAFHNYANFVFGVEQSEKFSKELHSAIRGTKNAAGKYEGGAGFNNFWGNVSKSWESSKSIVRDKSLWSVIKESFSKIPSEFKAASRLAKMTGKNSKYLGATGKILGKRMPLIGNVIMIATEIPNIYRSFTNPQGGFGTGVKEIGKTAAKLGGFAVGAAIGQALIPVPFLGAVVGGMVGGWVADKIVGKSFSEKLDEAKAQHMQQIPQQEEMRQAIPKGVQYAQRIPMNGQNPYAANPFAPSPYAQNPFNQGRQASFSPYSQMDFRDKDLMAMSAGLA